jgi:hypothetical protein
MDTFIINLGVREIDPECKPDFLWSCFWDDFDTSSEAVNEMATYNYVPFDYEPVVQRMLRYGELCSPEQIRDSGKFAKAPPRAYNQHLAVKVHGCYFYLAYDKKVPYASDAILLFHMSQFENVNTFIKILYKIFKRQFPAAWYGKISRNDSCLDLSSPATTVNRCVRKPRVQGSIVGRYDRGKRVYYLQGTGRKRLVTYISKVGHDRIPDDKKRAKKQKCTRLEYRKFGKKCDIANLSQLPLLRIINPFADLEVFKHDIAMVKNAPPRHELMLEGLLAKADEVGWPEVEAKYKGQIKTLRKYMGKADFDLLECWIRRLERFFGDMALLDILDSVCGDDWMTPNADKKESA